MDLNFCTVCYRETSCGDLYCGDSCREADTPEELRHLTPVASLRSSPTSAPGFSLATKHQGFRFRTFSGSSDEDEGEEDGNGGFVLPARRNFHGGNNLYRGTDRVPHHQNHAAKVQPYFGGGIKGAAAAAQGDVEDTEIEYLAALTKPLSLEHRDKPDVRSSGGMEQPSAKKTAKYIIKREFPGVF
jgi:hypothetical protein